MVSICIWLSSPIKKKTNNKKNKNNASGYHHNFCFFFALKIYLKDLWFFTLMLNRKNKYGLPCPVCFSNLFSIHCFMTSFLSPSEIACIMTVHYPFKKDYHAQRFLIHRSTCLALPSEAHKELLLPPLLHFFLALQQAIRHKID